MNPGDRRERDQLVKLLRRRMPGEPVVKPTTPELMDRLAKGFREDYDADADARQSGMGLLFNNERTDT